MSVGQEKCSLIGMGAIILDGADIGDYSLVAAGSVVTPHTKFENNSLIIGAPAKRVRTLTEEERKKKPLLGR